MTAACTKRGHGQRPNAGSSARTDASLISMMAMSWRASAGLAVATSRQSYVCASTIFPRSDEAARYAIAAATAPKARPFRMRAMKCGEL